VLNVILNNISVKYLVIKNMIFIEIKIDMNHIISAILIGTCISCVAAPVESVLHGK